MKSFVEFQQELFSYAQLRRAMFELSNVQPRKTFTFVHGYGFQRHDRRVRRGEVVKLKAGKLTGICRKTIAVVQMDSPGHASYTVGQFVAVDRGDVNDRIFAAPVRYSSSAMMRMMYLLCQRDAHLFARCNDES